MSETSSTPLPSSTKLCKEPLPGNPFTDSNGRHHYHNCECIICLKFQATCPRCQKEFTQYPAFRRHEKKHEKEDSLEKLRGRPQQVKLRRKGVIVPTAGGYLEKIVTDRDGYAAYNLGVFSRFAAALNDLRPTAKQFNRQHKLMLARIKKGELPLATIPTEIVARQAVSIYELALATNAQPGDIVSLLVSYGLEHLAKELRSSGSAPRALAPEQETKVFKKKESPHKEFLRENFPDQAPPEKGVEIVEYRSAIPDRTQPVKTSYVPSAFED